VIVQRIGSRQMAPADENQRAQVRETIGRRKLEDEWNRFLREMRGEAYVDVRAEFQARTTGTAPASGG
jgi:peptidyl-prolyl cis-trans isomerase SurA